MPKRRDNAGGRAEKKRRGDLKLYLRPVWEHYQRIQKRYGGGKLRIRRPEPACQGNQRRQRDGVRLRRGRKSDLCEAERGVQDTYGYTDAGWKDLLTSFNGQAITYDEIGNPSPTVTAYAFTWQYGRRLSSISHNGDSISYTYDPDGIRTSKTVNGTTTKYHVMNGTLLGQTKGNDTIVFLYDEKGNKYGFDYNGTKYYYIFNVQGDVIGILNQSGQKIVSYTNMILGVRFVIDGSVKLLPSARSIPIRYRGYYYDTETGFYYLQSRYYDPITEGF